MLWIALLGGLFMGAGPAQAADEMKPVLIVSGEGYDALMSDVGFVGKLTDNPGLGQQLDGMLAFFTQGQGVKGLDTKRPWGLVVTTDGVAFQPVAFLPVVNLKQLLTSLGPVIGEAKDKGEMFEVRKNNQSLFLKEAQGWAFVAKSPDGLVDLPKDPAKLIKKMSDKYDLAVQVNVQNIPEVYRELAVGQLKAQVQSGIQKDDDESKEAYEARKKMIEDRINTLVEAVNQTDQLILGWKLDGDTASSFFDVQIAAKTGSNIAKEIGLKSQTTSAFLNFLLPDAAVAATLSGKLSPEEQVSRTNELEVLKANIFKQIDEGGKVDDDDKDLAKQVAGDLINILKKTIATGRADAGAVVTLGDTLNLSAGFYVSDPPAVEKLFDKLKAAAKKETDKATFKDEKVGAISFHTVTMPIDNDKVSDVLGDDLEVTLGIGGQAVYLAIGKQGLETLKGLIGKSSAADLKAAPPFQATADLSSILKFVDENTDAPDQIGKLAEVAEQSSGKDHIRLRSIPGEGNITYRLEVEEGVLKVIGKASKNQGGGR
jgi:hypothetical protein